MRNRIKQRMLRRIALAFAVAAIAAPTAQAVPLEPADADPGRGGALASLERISKRRADPGRAARPYCRR